MKRRSGSKHHLKPSAAQLATLGSITSAALLAVLGPVTVTVTLSQGQHPAAVEQDRTAVRPICPLKI